MAERSTAAVGVAENSGEDETLVARVDKASADSATDGSSSSRPPEEARTDAEATGGTQDSESETAIIGQVDPDSENGPDGVPADAPDAGVSADLEATSTTPAPPELHSGHKLARRYRLEECVTRLDGFSSWRAVDEKLRRAVGVHILPTGHHRARAVLSAARSSALLGDPRFVQVLDAVEDHDLVYVVHEWLPDATPLSNILAAGPLEPHDAYQLVSQLSQALAAAHREGLSHLRLTPGTVLRTGSGQYRIRGLAVSAALRGISSETPQRCDTEGIGALLYAALTQRWPYEEDALRPHRRRLPHQGQPPRPRADPRRSPSRALAAGDARARQRRRHRLQPGASLRHTGGAGQGRLRDAAHQAPGDPVQRSAALPAHHLPAGPVRAGQLRTTRPRGRRSRSRQRASRSACSPRPHRQGAQVGCLGAAHRRAGSGQLAGRRHAPQGRQQRQRRDRPGERAG